MKLNCPNRQHKDIHTIHSFCYDNYNALQNIRLSNHSSNLNQLCQFFLPLQHHTGYMFQNQSRLYTWMDIYCILNQIYPHNIQFCKNNQEGYLPWQHVQCIQYSYRLNFRILHIQFHSLFHSNLIQRANDLNICNQIPPPNL